MKSDDACLHCLAFTIFYVMCKTFLHLSKESLPEMILHPVLKLK